MEKIKAYFIRIDNRMGSRKHKHQKQSKCKKYKTCKHVPCGQSMLNCEPSYCSNGSKNWGICNVMSKTDVRYRKTCKNQNKCKLVKNAKISKDEVPVITMNEKMPYIWRHLGKNTRKKMIKLARKPTEEININYMK